MARRKHGRPVHGWLLIDKPAGLTSAAVIAKAKWAFQARKAGHAGTLDPAATGLLAIAFGEATKTVPYIADATKTYRFTLRWGAATTTDDAEGAITATSDVRPGEDDIRDALPLFTGDIMQVPPQVSAVKVAGHRAYDLARRGERTELAPRPLRIDRLDLVAIPHCDIAILEMVCGKGGYVRSLGRDLGEHLGCLAHVSELRRLRTGHFDVEEAAGLHRVVEPEHLAAIDSLLLPVAAGLRGLPELPVTPDAAAILMHGNPAPIVPPSGLAEGAAVWAGCNGRPVAVGNYRQGALHPRRVFVYD